MTRTLTASTIPLALAAVTEVAPTVAGVCDRLASQKDATTAATYRARLRPVIAAYGALQAPAALRRLTELETELCSVLGENAAHKAVTLLRAALRDAGFDLLTLVDAAAITGIAIPSLRALVDRGKVCCRDRRRHGRGESMLFDAVELASDLAALDLCPQPGCDKLGIGPSGYCGDHFAQGGRQGAARKERRLLGGKRDWYTVDEAARRLDESRTAITSRCARGELPSEKIGRHRRIPQEAVEQLRKARVGRRTKPKPTAEERDAQRQRVREFWEQPAYNGKPRAIANELDCSKPT
ncbi:MAG: helix-turn-helix domain-containing protein, partial [Solirubrobacteraceae bacterium]